MKPKHFLIALAILVIPLSLLASLYVPKGIKARKHEQTMKLAPVETDHVTLEDVQKKTFYIEDKQPIGSTVYYWKLRSGNQVLNFEHVPDNIFWKWNVNEAVPAGVILKLMRIDEQIHETYNLHITRQR
ncbi:hypothetical protein [Pedobacter sp. BMA]|uniref:hypothetical protein n=1 Tax=Pedobacter sp. BMA TaxID=1663685 RepID=UPI00064A531F|nr:hypothetical protein [Pedobacter sp. BMA]KLT63973.1 hypothetical protein AB669_19840 [Pedobacter sp. BMA]